jgi:glutamate--cysteine ligase catalytic subunit
MVVSFDDKEKNAKLSLRQQEILEKLDSVVDDISAGALNKYVPWLPRHQL